MDDIGSITPYGLFDLSSDNDFKVSKSPIQIEVQSVVTSDNRNKNYNRDSDSLSGGDGRQ